MWYRLELVAPKRRLASALSPFNPHYDWTVDAVGNHLLVKATGYGAFGLISNSVFSDPFAVVPDPPKVTAPIANELLSAGSTYTVRWTQTPPHADSYRILFSANGGTDFQQLGPDVSGPATSATVQVRAAPTDDGRLRVEGIFDGFDPAFLEDVKVRTTSAPVVRVTRPGAGAIWHNGRSARVAKLPAPDRSLRPDRVRLGHERRLVPDPARPIALATPAARAGHARAAGARD